jgi:hypothetical protein
MASLGETVKVCARRRRQVFNIYLPPSLAARSPRVAEFGLASTTPPPSAARCYHTLSTDHGHPVHICCHVAAY